MPENCFSRFARAKCDEKFVIINRSFGIAEIGLGRCNCRTTGKTFLARSFDSEETFTLCPKWEISQRGKDVFVTRRLDDGEEPDSGKFYSEFDALLDGIPEIPCEAMPAVSPPQEVGGDWYLRTAQSLIEEIRAGVLKKIVLARSVRSRADAPVPAALIFEKLRERFGESCTVFSISCGGKTFLGATPETLALQKNGLLETEALAGSIANFPGANTAMLAERLLANDKERREHRTVVDFISEKLRATGLHPEFPEIPEVVRLPNILHLRTPICARRVPGTGILDIVAALHPTPAMCGVPAALAREKILQTEPFPRGFFAGPLGFYEPNGEGFFAVGIRCAEISGNEIRLFAGSGLVDGSTPEQEFEEINSKFSAVLSLIRR